MAKKEHPGGESAEPRKLKVFISYSRTEVRFADELELFLRNSGFEPKVDRHGIDVGEDWKKRLDELILECDTVIFVLSDTSAASPICAWEVEEAARLSKRILAATLGPVSSEIAPPPELAGINWVSCWANPAIPGSSQTKGFFDLEQALRTDLGWVRRRTELQEQAAGWLTRGAGADSPFLLRDEQVAEALEWSRAAPEGHDIPADVARFIAASEDHERKLKSKALAQARAVRRTGLIGAGVAALFLVAALLAGALALRGFDQVAQQTAQNLALRSDFIAREAAAIFDGETGDPATSLLMALYADPAAANGALDRRYAPAEGYAQARARLSPPPF